MFVPDTLCVDMDAAVELADMLVKGRLEPDIAQLAPAEPLGREPLHFGDHRLGVDVGSAEEFERARLPPDRAERCVLESYGAVSGARHMDLPRDGAGIEQPTVFRPAETGAHGTP